MHDIEWFKKIIIINHILINFLNDFINLFNLVGNLNLFQIAITLKFALTFLQILIQTQYKCLLFILLFLHIIQFLIQLYLQRYNQLFSFLFVFFYFQNLILQMVKSLIVDKLIIEEAVIGFNCPLQHWSYWIWDTGWNI